MRGIALIAAAYLLYALGDAAAKLLVHELPVWQVLCVRSAMGVAFCLAAGARGALAQMLRASNRGQLLAMSAANFLAWAAYYAAANYLQLPQLYVMYYVSPILATLMAGAMLGEVVRTVHWLATLLGFGGVLLAVPPVGPLPALLPALLGLAAAVLWAYSSVLYRANVARNSNLELMLINNLAMLLCSGAPMPWLWHGPAWPQWGLLALTGVTGLAAHYLYLSGIRRVPVAVAGPIGFSSLLWSVVLGYLVWHELPGWNMLAGGALIMLAALLMLAAGGAPAAGAVRGGE